MKIVCDVLMRALEGSAMPFKTTYNLNTKLTKFTINRYKMLKHIFHLLVYEGCPYPNTW